MRIFKLKLFKSLEEKEALKRLKEEARLEKEIFNENLKKVKEDVKIIREKAFQNQEIYAAKIRQQKKERQAFLKMSKEHQKEFLEQGFKKLQEKIN